jgi:hypothetical protein
VFDSAVSVAAAVPSIVIVPPAVVA